MPDAIVDRLEVVDVEDDERQAPVVAVGAGAFARERLVEVAAVVQVCQRVEIGELAGLTEAACVVDRRPRAPGELLEKSELPIGGFALTASPEHRQGADRLILVVAQRNGDAASDQVAVLARFLAAPAVGDADRACSLSVGRPPDRLTRGLLRGHPPGRNEWLLLARAVSLREGDQRRVDVRQALRGFQGPSEHAVEIDADSDCR